MEKVYKHWKWTKNNNKCEKTLRETKPTNVNNAIQMPHEEEEFHEVVEDIYRLKSISLLEESKKALNNERISQRHLMVQTNINPFLKQKGYLEDLNIQDTFLRPQDSKY